MLRLSTILTKPANIFFRGKDNKTCLHWAIDKGHMSVVRTVLAANPDIEVRTVDGDTPLLRYVHN